MYGSGNRREGHEQIDVSYPVPDARAHTHAHIQKGKPWCMPWCRLAGVLGQQSELLPSDDTACEDDVGTSAQSGAPMITMHRQPGSPAAQMGQPDQPCCHPKFAETGFPRTSNPTGHTEFPEQGLLTANKAKVALPALSSLCLLAVYGGNEVTHKDPIDFAGAYQLRAAGRLTLTGSSSYTRLL